MNTIVDAAVAAERERCATFFNKNTRSAPDQLAADEANDSLDAGRTPIARPSQPEPAAKPD